jgi:tyrosine-specific transport protein
MDLKTWDAVATMLGAVIGAGILAIPFVLAQAGLVSGIVNIIVLGLAILALHLMVGEVVLRTKGDHQLAGYARLYVGKTGGRLMTLSLVVGIYGALLAYLLGMGESFSQLVGGTPLVWTALAFVLMGLLLAQRLDVIEKSERYLSALKIVAILVISAIAFLSQRFTTANYAPTTSWTLPFGVVLFSLLGTAAIPEVREELKGQYRKLKPALLWAGIIAIIVYLLFAVSVVGVTGATTSEIATAALGQQLGTGAFVLLNLFALLAMTSAFLALGEALKKSFEEDYGWQPLGAWCITMLVPAVLVLLGARSFITIIGLTGAVAGGIDGILIVMMYRKALKKGSRTPEYRLNMPVWLQMVVLAVFVLALLWAVVATLGLL